MNKAGDLYNSEQIRQNPEKRSILEKMDIRKIGKRFLIFVRNFEWNFNMNLIEFNRILMVYYTFLNVGTKMSTTVGTNMATNALPMTPNVWLIFSNVTVFPC